MKLLKIVWLSSLLAVIASPAWAAAPYLWSNVSIGDAASSASSFVGSDLSVASPFTAIPFKQATYGVLPSTVDFTQALLKTKPTLPDLYAKALGPGEVIVSSLAINSVAVPQLSVPVGTNVFGGQMTDALDTSLLSNALGSGYVGMKSHTFSWPSSEGVSPTGSQATYLVPGLGIPSNNGVL